jgi:hypothetical protein
MAETGTFVLTIQVMSWPARLIALGWLIVGIAAITNSDFSDRWLWASIGTGSGILFLLAARPVRVIFDDRRRIVVLRRPTLPWKVIVSEWPMSDIATAGIIVHERAQPYDPHWCSGREGLVLVLRSGEQVPILDRTFMDLEGHRDRINERLGLVVR